MKRKRGSILITILLVLLISACDGGLTTNGKLSGLNRDAAKSYTATFTVQFDGPSDWVYRLQTRKSPTLREENLHIDGIEQARNPGDIRLVTDGSSTRMIGPGTDNECVQFPNNQGMDPALIVPETLVGFSDLNGLLAYVEDEQILGKTSEHYSGSGLAIGNWQNATIDLWIDKSNKMLLRFIMQADVQDPFFGTGAGTLVAGYEVNGLDAPAVEPVGGCEISVPLPDSAVKVVRLPGMASFETSASVEEIKTFYQAALPQQAWVENGHAAQSDEILVLSYTRAEEIVEIQIKAQESGGSKVQMIFP
jgi:hypothetical protein